MDSPTPPRAAFLSGVRDVAPMLIGVLPFGVIAGALAVEAGFSTVQALAASVVIFAGSAQLATTDLFAGGSPAMVIVLTGLIINSRHFMYSATLAPTFRHLPPGRKSLAAYLMTDQAFGVSVVRFRRLDEPLQARLEYYLGAGFGLWLTWQISTAVGVVVGTGLPPSLSLDFAVPLVFLALLFPAVTDRPTLAAAVAGGVSASALVGMPLGLGLLTGSAIGILVGLVVSRRGDR